MGLSEAKVSCQYEPKCCAAIYLFCSCLQTHASMSSYLTEVLQALSTSCRHFDQTRLMHCVAIVHLKICMMTQTFTPALQSRMSCRGMEDGDRYGRSWGGHHCSS